MKKNQRFTPKYWVFHDATSDDLFIATASKGLDLCESKAELLYPKEFKEFLTNNVNNNYKFDLFEIDMAIK